MKDRGFTIIEVIVAPLAIIVMLLVIWIFMNIVGYFLPKHTPNINKVKNELMQFEESPEEDYWQYNVR